jgi:hypothetical protein
VTPEASAPPPRPTEGDPTSIDEYRALMGLYPTGVTIVTCATAVRRG